MSEPRWFEDGLRFECHRCGHCCRGSGNVWISEREIELLASSLQMPEEELRATYTRRGRGGTLLRAKRNRDCVFWEDRRGCTIYSHRPRQCRTYPFWRGIVHSQESWEREGQECRGIGEGQLYGPAEIDARSGDDGIPGSRTRQRTAADGSG